LAKAQVTIAQMKVRSDQSNIEYFPDVSRLQRYFILRGDRTQLEAGKCIASDDARMKSK
jgi:hypothetical protein